MVFRVGWDLTPVQIKHDNVMLHRRQSIFTNAVNFIKHQFLVCKEMCAYICIVYRHVHVYHLSNTVFMLHGTFRNRIKVMRVKLVLNKDLLSFARMSLKIVHF